jgi:2-iminoacetate synthase
MEINPAQQQHKKGQGFIDRERLYDMLDRDAPSSGGLDEILNRAFQLKGLPLDDVASLLTVEDPAQIRKIIDCARYVKDEIYGRRLVLFAPVYTGNVCDNDCVYCAFRKSNTTLKRRILTMPEIEREVRSLLREGHKRILLICGEPRKTIPITCAKLFGLHMAFARETIPSGGSIWNSRRWMFPISQN